MLLAKFGVVALAIGLAVWLISGTIDGVWMGKPIVLDGDTLEFEKGQVHLFGIDAPEFSQRCESAGKSWACGAYSTAALLTAVHGNSVWCFEKGRDANEAVIAKCYAGLSDLASELVERGWATVSTDLSGQYLSELTEAKTTRRGIWSSTFASPADWRAQARP